MLSTMKTRLFPFDLIPLVLEHVTDKRDLCNCALVDRAFHTAVTPFLYQTLDTKIRFVKVDNGSRVLHPATTLLQQPEYAYYVRHISETATSGDVASVLTPIYRATFPLCTNLRSYSWAGGGFLSEDDSGLVASLETIISRGFPVDQLLIRASPGLGAAVWNQLRRLTTLRSLGLWCLEADHEALYDWLRGLGGTLTRLELVTSPLSDHYLEYISCLPRLRSLCLKSAARCSVLDILSMLPQLEELEIEYYGFSPTAQQFRPPVPSLRSLTITTTAIGSGPQEMWAWIPLLVPRPSLESFTLRAFSAQRTMYIPLTFMKILSSIHGQTLRYLAIEDVQLGSQVFNHVCRSFPHLTHLSCSLPYDATIDTVGSIITHAHELRSLKVSHGSFTLDIARARQWMVRDGSRLRSVQVGQMRFKARSRTHLSPPIKRTQFHDCRNTLYRANGYTRHPYQATGKCPSR
ncbi:hypothetical protein BDW22DRAFT_1183451 [Trametopsis cervina]|nr:hypothetical protein BDW22DRAFT_1183451 [Trametopsis cervina]